MYKTHPNFTDVKTLRNVCFGIEAHNGPGLTVWLQEGNRTKQFSDHSAGPNAGSPSLTLCPFPKAHT